MKFNNLYIFFIILAFSSTSFTMQIIGHRGACGYAPENTLSSFQKALDLGVDIIELDVHVCATGEVVVIHDDTVNRTTNGSGYVADMTFNELRSLVVGGTEQIPTLQEVIELVNRQVPINIELKGSFTAEPVAEILAMFIENGWSSDDFMVSSFQHDRVAIFQLFCPDVRTGLLFDDANYDDFIDIALFYEVDFIAFSYKLFVPEVVISQEFIDDAHFFDLQLFVFTINGSQTANLLASMNIDGIFTDYPDRVQ
ncbi:MAG: glycerophosphodiester phosphodiesterase [Candidatus Dependentiae bacterium]|nr:glycerophosphodiester phosphodiesterase [Candidatus Dependentiae bacterium]